MGRIKKKLRAQRKFAQGAFIPPQNQQAIASAPVAHGSHRAVNAPGRVIYNACSASDLLTRMSLGKLHHHYNLDLKPWTWTLDVNCGGLEPSEPTAIKKKKNEEERKKKHISYSQKKKYVQRNRPKGLAAHSSIQRRVSVSDSGEDMPLSCFTSCAVSKPLERRKSAAAASAAEETAESDSNSSSPIATLKAVNTILRKRPARRSEPPVASTSRLTPPTPKSRLTPPAPKSRLMLSSPASRLTSSRITPPSATCRLTRPARTQSLKPPAPSTQLRLDSANNMRLPILSKSSERNMRLKRSTRGFSTFSDTSTVTSFDSSKKMDPDYELSDDESCISELILKSRRRPLKRKAIAKNSAPGKKHKTHSNVNICPSDPSAPIAPLQKTAEWVASLPNSGTATLVGVEEDDLSVTASETHRQTAPVSGSTVSPEASDDKTHFKLPNLPVYRTKLNKTNCPTYLVHDLHKLLNTQSNKKNLCKACKRCELIAKYKKVLSKLPVSNDNEPDVLETTPPDVYEFDSDDEGFKFLRRGRELVRNVLTTKRLLIWLSNLKMNLKKTMFQDEHKLGTLKRTIMFNKDDVADATVIKVIARVDYLNRCLIEDKKELNAEKSRQRLRSSKGAVSPTSKVLPLKRANFPHRSRPPPVRPSGSAEDISPPAADSDSRRLVICITPLEEMVEQGALPVTSQLNGKSMKNIDIKETSNLTRNIGHEKINKDVMVVVDSTSSSSLEDMDVDTGIPHVISNLFDNPIDVDSFPNFGDHQPIQIENPKGIDIDFEKLVYRPTSEEFKDPIEYIAKIQKGAKQFGICKIIPPQGFDVPCHLDEKSMFTTMNQYLGRLYQRWGPTSRELTMIQTYLAMLANPRERDQFTRAPMFDGLELDLVRLYHIVLEHGGIEKLLAHSEKWARIVEQLCLVSPRGKPDHKKLEKLYCKHVLPYESLSHYDRENMKWKVDRVWGERFRSALRRAERPLTYQKRMLGECDSDDEEPPLDSRPEDVRSTGKTCFDRIEECTGKGRTMNLSVYRRIAGQIKTMCFGAGAEPTTLEVEETYWRMLALGNEHRCVLSAFIDTSVDNLGHTADPDGPGGRHPWNLKRLGENPRNVLSSLGKTLSVTVPTLCLNQVFSTNCWHMDPHKLAWMDFMHEGKPKIWYAVSEQDSGKFRRAMEFLTPTAVHNKGIWLASDTTMVPPGLLMHYGVKLQRIVQNPGEFIVVFPGAYASSIATGLTISESIYFENKDWLYNIDNIFNQMHLDCEPAMFSNILLILRMARDPAVAEDVLPLVQKSVHALLLSETKARLQAASLKCKITVDQSGRPAGGQPIAWPHQDECFICRTPLILSKTVRHNDPRSLMCLKHGLRMFECAPSWERADPPPVTLLYSDSELKAVNAALARRIMEISTPHSIEKS